MFEHVLPQQMGLIEEEDGVYSFAPQRLDVLVDSGEDGGGRRLGTQTQGVTQLPIEVAAPERRVAAVGKAETGLGQAMPQRPQSAGLANARLTGEQDVLVLLNGFDEAVDDANLGRGQPQSTVRDILVEGRLVQ
jgi:hypothetical protein